MTSSSKIRSGVPWVVGLACMFAAFWIDAWGYHHIVFRSVYDHDWGRALRDVGYWPTWAVVALGLWLHDRGGMGAARTATAGRLRTAPTVAWRGWALIASVTVAGIVAELLKMIVRRERPSMHDGAYGFRAWADRPLSSSGFGFPSSHSVEAFSAAVVLSYFFPESRWLWWGLAIACAVTRVLAGAHFVSDVIAGALLGAAIATWIVKRV